MAWKTADAREFFNLSDTELDALIHQDFATFVQMMFPQVNPGTELLWAGYLSLLCSRLQDVAHGKRKRLIITMPPRHLKSFCVSVALPAFILGHYPNQDVMCVSYGLDLAKEFGRQFLALTQSDLYRRVFGSVIKRERQPLTTLRTNYGGVRRATSLDGTATGVGGDALIFDDPQKPGETLSDAIRRASNASYENTFVSRGNNPVNTRIIIVMQRLHEDDFVSHVLSLGDDWEIINFPAIAEASEAIPYATFAGPRVFRRREGEALHPTRMPIELLEKQRATVGEAIWATQYQQRPAPAGGGLVKTAWFRRYDEQERPAFDRIIQSWDTANKVGEWNDWSVCTTWGVKGKDIYLLHVFRKRLEYPDLKKAVREQARLHSATLVLVEEHQSGVQILQELRRDGFGQLRAVKAKKDKQVRMINQTSILENGLVHIPREAPWLAEYLHELAMFPNGKWDDQVDSTSQALNAIAARSDGENYEEFMRQVLEERRRGPQSEIETA